MINSSQQKDECSLKLSYHSFGDGYVVHSDSSDSEIPKVFVGQLGVDKLQNVCESQENCKHAVCAYKQELIVALGTENRFFRPQKQAV